MAGRRREEAHAVVDRAALGVGRAVIEPADARERDRRRAHRAGLERDMQVAVGEPLGAELAVRRRGSRAFRHARSDRGRSSVRLPAAAITAPSRTITQPIGTSPQVLRLARLVQRQFHEGRHSTPRMAQPCIKAWMPGIKPGMTKDMMTDTKATKAPGAPSRPSFPRQAAEDHAAEAGGATCRCRRPRRPSASPR